MLTESLMLERCAPNFEILIGDFGYPAVEGGNSGIGGKMLNNRKGGT